MLDKLKFLERIFLSHSICKRIPFRLEKSMAYNVAIDIDIDIDIHNVILLIE